MPTGLDICMLVPTIPPEFAGGGKLAYDQATYMASQGEKCTIVTKTRRGVKRPNLDIVWMPQLAVGARQRGRIVDYVSLYPRFLRVLKQLDPDVVHVMSADAWTLLGVAAAKTLGLPVALETSLAESDDPVTIRNSRFGAIKFAILEDIDALISVSPLLDDLAAEGGIPPQKRHLIGNLVDVDLFVPATVDRKAALRQKLGLQDADLVMIYVGAIIERKRVLEVIQALDALPPELRSRTTAAIVGPIMDDAESPAYQRTLEAYVADKGLGDQVVFTGGVDNVQEWMAASDMFVFASAQEGFGTVVVEAMAAGLPVVVRRIPRISEFILTEGEDGHITDSQEEFVQRIGELLADADKRSRYAVKARENAVRRFSEQAICDAYLDLFQDLVARN